VSKIRRFRVSIMGDLKVKMKIGFIFVLYMATSVVTYAEPPPYCCFHGEVITRGEKDVARCSTVSNYNPECKGKKPIISRKRTNFGHRFGPGHCVTQTACCSSEGKALSTNISGIKLEMDLQCSTELREEILLVTINKFSATRNGSGKVKIKLVTASEVDTAVLQIYRAPSILQNLQQIQEVCRWDGVGTGVSGSDYSCKDENAPASVVYWPAEVEYNGTINNYLEFTTNVK
jgi:hypothetical protein